MRVLLFSVTAGEGHNATAHALASALEALGAQTRVLDAYRTSGRLMYHIIDKGYLLVSAYLGRGYGLFYHLLERRRGNSYRGSLSRLSGRSNAKKFKRAIEEFDPDVIVCTHSFASRILDIVKERYGLRAKTVGVVTDFTVHPYWEEALRLDRLVIPCEALSPLALTKGFREEQLRPLGIPIDPKFSVSLEKREAREILHLSPTLPTLLLMSGSMGHGGICRLLSRIDAMEEAFQLIVVCGNNEKMRKKIAGRKWKKPMLLLGYTRDVPLLMDAADAILSKPGGLSTSEALVRRLPMVIFDPIPGHEERNMEFLTAAGTAIAIKGKRKAEDAVREILSDETRERMRACIEKIRKPSAATDLCAEILALAKEASQPSDAEEK
jgi:processive 1,2-diacylglycerol beta-glucosyltransferase